LPVLGLKLANSLLFGCQRLADPALAAPLSIDLRDPTTYRSFTKIHIAAYLPDAQTLVSDHLYGLQLETPVKFPALLFHQFLLYG
jgi:hypothetical protein